MFAMASSAGTGGGKEGEPGQLLAKQGSKLHAAMLSKEAAAQLAAPSFRVYYPVSSAGAVPFLWESQPGTPKNDGSPSAAALTPPLTPPPSYYSSAGKGGNGGGRSSSTRQPGLLGAILPRRIALIRRRPGGSSSRTAPACSSWSSSSWSSSSSSNASATMSPVFTVQSKSSPAVHVGASRGHHRRAFSAGAGVGDDDEKEEDTPRCFLTERECCERRVVKGCGVAVAVRNALATVVGGKQSGRRAAATTSAAA